MGLSKLRSAGDVRSLQSLTWGTALAAVIGIATWALQFFGTCVCSYSGIREGTAPLVGLLWFTAGSWIAALIAGVIARSITGKSWMLPKILFATPAGCLFVEFWIEKNSSWDWFALPILIPSYLCGAAGFWCMGRRYGTTYEQGRCQRCGYKLNGSVSGRCPECGVLILPGVCPHCRRKLLNTASDQCPACGAATGAIPERSDPQP